MNLKLISLPKIIDLRGNLTFIQFPEQIPFEIKRIFWTYDVPGGGPKGDNKKSRWTLKKKISLAKDFFFSSSTFPIKLITYLELFFSVFSFVIIIIYAYARLIRNDNFWKLSEVPGWTSTVIIISFFSGLIFFSLGITAEYIWRIFEEVKNRPGYIIKKK